MSRKLEDKLNNHKVELRSFTLNLNVDDLHKNRELPSAYVCYLGVLDSTLPEPESTINAFLGLFYLYSPMS